MRPLVKGKQKKMNGGKPRDLDQGNLQLSSSEIIPKKIKAKAKTKLMNGRDKLLKTIFY